MPLVTPEPPPEVLEAFTAGLPAFVGKPVDDPIEFAAHLGEPPEIPTLAELGPNPTRAAQQVFLLGLNDAAGVRGSERAVPVGWRFFAGQSQRTALLGRVSRRDPAKPWRMTSAHYGPGVWAAFQESLALRDLPQVKPADYELRSLSIPALYLEAFWLVARDRKDPDLIVPFPPAPQQPIRALNEERVFTLPDFLATIRTLALSELSPEAPAGV
jgi:hypothetical protein